MHFNNGYVAEKKVAFSQENILRCSPRKWWHQVTRRSERGGVTDCMMIGRYSQVKMTREWVGSADVTVETDWFDRYNTEENSEMDACFNAFDKDG